MQKSILPMSSEPYRIIHSAKRKRIALKIANDGVLELLVPQLFNDRLAPELLAANAHLINKLHSTSLRRQILDFSGKTEFMLLGEPFKLRHTHHLRLFDDAFLIPRGNDDEIKFAMIALYKELAAAIFRKRISLWEDKCSLHPQKIRITSANTRWGSCTSAGVISLSWKLVQCPLTCIDYVVVHELSHLKEMNHSAMFWKCVADILPDYRQYRQQLKIFSRTLPFWD